MIATSVTQWDDKFSHPISSKMLLLFV